MVGLSKTIGDSCEVTDANTIGIFNSGVVLINGRLRNLARNGKASFSSFPACRHKFLCYVHTKLMSLSPVKRGYCFRFVCPSGTLFSHFVRVTPPIAFITHKQNLYHLQAGCLGCVMGGQFFRTPQNFGEIGLWKRPKITNSNFWSVTSRRVLGLGMRYSNHMKALLL